MTEENLRLIDAMTVAKERGEWENAARLCREGVVATATATFVGWYAFRFNLVLCLKEIGNDSAIDEAISVCREILARVQSENVLHKMPVVAMALGGLYNRRRKGVRSENLEGAIAYYEMSLKCMDPRRESLLWAGIAMLLGDACVELDKLLGPSPDGARFDTHLLRTASRIFAHNDCLDEARSASDILGEVLKRSHGEPK